MHEHQPSVTPVDLSTEQPSPPAETGTFADMGLRPEILAALSEIGFEKPTPVQHAVVPLALAGRDLLVQSRTGTGKTAAFVMPLCQGLLDLDLLAVQALVLTPTRELALQVAQESTRIAAHLPLSVATLYGGANIQSQIRALRQGAQLVSGTPGRVLDHLRRTTLDPKRIAVLVLDECDEMLSMGFAEEINAILERLPKARQTLLFSATVPKDIERFASRILTDPQQLSLSDDSVSVQEIEHAYYFIGGGDRFDHLRDILEHERPRSALIFCNTRDETARVASYLQGHGFRAEGISSDLSQADRERVMRAIKEQTIDVLAATDIAARGIDIPDLSHVFNFTFPETPDVYVHRTGRTARAGKRGIALSLVSPKEIGSFRQLRLIHRIVPQERELPSAKNASQILATRLATLRERFGQRGASAELCDFVQRVWSLSDGPALLAAVLEDALAVRRTPAVSATSATSAVARPQLAARQPAGRGRDGRQRTSARRDSDRRPAPLKQAPRRDHENVFVTPDGDVEVFETVSANRSRAPSHPTDGFVRVYLALGRQHRELDAEAVSALVAREGATTADKIGRIDMHDRYSFVAIAHDVVDDVIARLRRAHEDDRSFRIERARTR